MIGNLLKLYAYGKAPRTTLAARHPVKAARMYAYTKAPRAAFAVNHPRTAGRGMKLRWDMRHALAPRVTAIGVAALTLPLGYALGRAITRNGGREDEEY